MSKIRYLPDVNVLLALTNDNHEFHGVATAWFKSLSDGDLLLCPLTETSLLRLSCVLFNKNLRDAIFLLRALMQVPGFAYMSVRDSWLNISAPYIWRLQGHKQITDAYLLGIAIQEQAILVTLDQRIQAWATPDYDPYLLSLETSK
jgi:predicted nucleic acid-binding protein